MPKKLLIVDDSASIRKLVAFTLQDAGYDVLVAEHGKNALAKLADTPVDMIITDLNMPEMDGNELIRRVRGMGPYKFTPIVMLTTEAQEKMKIEGKNAGANGWIVKPFKPEQLAEIVRKFME